MLMINKTTRNENSEQEKMQDLFEHMFPPKITRRDALTLFSGFDKNANRKILGALMHLFKDRSSEKL